MEECIGNFLFAGICCVVSVVSVICVGKFTCFVVTVICCVAQNHRVPFGKFSVCREVYIYCVDINVSVNVSLLCNLSL